MTLIETERLVLRPLRQSDLATLAAVLNNFNISKNTAHIHYPYALSDAEDFFTITRKCEPPSLLLSITRKSGGGIIGGVGYTAEPENHSVELGYWLAEAEWGKGIGSEAACAMVAHAFEIGRHPKLVASFHHGNTASGRILAGLGFEPIDTAMNYSRAQGKDVPVTKLVLTREKWQGRST